MAINIEELLSELEGAEKTAEESFVDGVTSDEAEATEEKVAEAEVEETEETEEKVAEQAETEVEETEEKVAETQESEEEKVEEKVASATDQDRELVKQAEDMGKIVAHSFYAELVAMGVMPATNKDMVVPPISAISMPMQSPVTVKADAMAAEKGQKKTASVITPEFLTNLHNKIYSEE